MWRLCDSDALTAGSVSALTLSPDTNPPISDCTNKVSTRGETSTSAGF